MKHLPALLLSAFLVRLLVTGASIGEALVIIALSAVYAGQTYLTHTKEPVINKEIKDRLVELEESVKITREKLSTVQMGILKR